MNHTNQRHSTIAAVVGSLGLISASLAVPASGCSGGSSTVPDLVTAGASGAGGVNASGMSGGSGRGGAAAGSGGFAGTSPDLLQCGDGVCDHESAEECDSCPADCGACPVCGDGVCAQLAGGLESCESCEADCGACSECGDGTCSAASGESCTSCPGDCGACEGCGDGTCAASETCASCAKDCGACKTCGDGVCSAGESCSTCADDCGACSKCGDGTCDKGETASSCAKDCAAPTDRKGCIVGDFEPYWGGLHAHTHFSPDAAGPDSGYPGDAFAHAKKASPPLDFLWISDHHNHLSPAQYKSCQDAANKHNDPGTFVAGCGWENGIYEGAQNSAWTGHFNVLFPDKYYKMAINIPEIYQEVAKCEPCLGQFNHPPDPKDMHNYQHYPVAQDRVRLVEFNGGASFEVHLAKYRLILNNGWKVSPSWNEDNHHGKWGDSPNATLVWAASLSRIGIRAGVLANRTAATNDDTASLKMVADGKCWMGSELEGLGATTLTVTLRDKQPKDGFGPVTLYDPKGNEVDKAFCKGENPCKVDFSVNVKEPTYYFVVARQQDNDVLISAPIWYRKKSLRARAREAQRVGSASSTAWRQKSCVRSLMTSGYTSIGIDSAA